MPLPCTQTAVFFSLLNVLSQVLSVLHNHLERYTGWGVISSHNEERAQETELILPKVKVMEGNRTGLRLYPLTPCGTFFLCTTPRPLHLYLTRTPSSCKPPSSLSFIWRASNQGRSVRLDTQLLRKAGLGPQVHFSSHYVTDKWLHRE